METALDVSLILAVGLVAGTINTMVGGGTYIVLPLLVFLGLPPHVANGTNRFCVSLQSLAAFGALRSTAGSLSGSLPLAILALGGGVLGAYLNTLIDADRFRTVMGWILLVGVVLFFVKPRNAGNRAVTHRARWIGLLGVGILGIYGGFMGAGVGVLILVFLTPLLGYDLVRMVSVKVLMVFSLSLSSGAVYVWNGMVDWLTVVPLSVAYVSGGLLGARLTLRGGEEWVRRTVSVVGAVMALLLILGWSPT